MLKKLYYAALSYMVAGLAAGVYYREITKITGFTGKTMLSVLHTHLLVLGMFFFLFLIVLEKNFTLSESRLFPTFYWVYNIGVIWTVAILAIHGTITVTGGTAGAAVAGIAGMGHIVLSAGLILFFILLRERLFDRENSER